MDMSNYVMKLKNNFLRNMENNFAVFILTHGRPDNVKTFKNLWLNLKDSDIYSSEYFLNGISIYSTKPLENKLTNTIELILIS